MQQTKLPFQAKAETRYGISKNVTMMHTMPTTTFGVFGILDVEQGVPPNFSRSLNNQCRDLPGAIGP